MIYEIILKELKAVNNNDINEYIKYLNTEYPNNEQGQDLINIELRNRGLK